MGFCTEYKVSLGDCGNSIPRNSDMRLREKHPEVHGLRSKLLKGSYI